MLTKKQNNKGFSLVELMVVVAIIAILAAVAYPSYNNSVRKTARSTAQGDLADAAMAMERHRAQNMTYVGATVGATFGQFSPDTATSAGTARYQLAFVAGQPTATTFEIIATPLGDQAKTDNGVMKINNLGQRCWSKSPTSTDCTFGTDVAW